MQSLSDVLSMECKPLNISVMHVAPASIVSNISTNGAARYTLPSTSLYAAFLPNIMQRIYASQHKGSMPTEEFARRVVEKALPANNSKRGPPVYLSAGGGAFMFTVLRWLPRSLLLYLMWRVHSKKLPPLLPPR
jgi:1-acylglycerone phosphate reductase